MAPTRTRGTTFIASMSRRSLVSREPCQKLRSTIFSELDEAIHMIEMLEEENLHLRGEIKQLQKQREERTRVVVHVIINRSSAPSLRHCGSGN